MKSLKYLFIFLFFIPVVQAQNWDYEKYPLLDVEFRHLEAEIRIHPRGLIEGDLRYQIRFRTDDIETVTLDAVRMDISSVRLDGEVKEFHMEDDQLVISLNRTQRNSEDTATLRIQYQAEPVFGLHRSNTGTLWTSLLPKSTGHWMPVKDHPRVAFTTEIEFTHPAGHTLISNGRKVDDRVAPGGQVISRFQSDTPLAASTLSWSFGEFLIEETISAGLQEHQLSFYSETEEAASDELLQMAASSFRTVEEQLGVAYPFDNLHLVFLEDDQWETKSYGSGIVYLFKNRGSLEKQIQQGVLSQWIGAWVREEQWNDADAILAMRALLTEKLFPVPDPLDAGEQESGLSSEPYSVFSGDQLLLWEHFLRDRAHRTFRNQLEDVLPSIVSNGQANLGWHELAEIIYNRTGRPWFDGFTPDDALISFESEYKEYVVEMQLNEEQSTIQLQFRALGEGTNELVTAEAHEITMASEEFRGITFTGNSDSVVLNVSRGIENLKLNIVDRNDLILHEEKPFYFWIYQLRNDEDDKRRADAAAALAQFSDNPDLQLVFTDLFRTEENPVVYAEILRSFSGITRGASGTEQMFLERLSGQNHPEIQKAAAEGLAFFRANNQVINQLNNTIVRTSNRQVRRAAIRSLYETTDGEQFGSMAESLITNEPVMDEAPLLLNLLAKKGEVETAIQLSSDYISENFPYKIRSEALNLLLQIDNNPSNWEDRLPPLLSDRDARIRYTALQGLEKIGSNHRNELVRARQTEERDERVRRKLIES